MKKTLTLLFLLIGIISFTIVGKSFAFDPDKPIVIEPQHPSQIIDSLVYTPLETSIENHPFSKSKVEFRLYGKKISEYQEKMVALNGDFVLMEREKDTVSVYILFVSRHKDVSPWGFLFIDVASGEVIKKVKLNVPLVMELSYGKVIGNYFVYAGPSKSKTNHYCFLVDCHTGEVVRKKDISSFRYQGGTLGQVVLPVSLYNVVIGQKPRSKKEAKNTIYKPYCSNIMSINFLQDSVAPPKEFRNKFFTKHNNKPHIIISNDAGYLYVQYMNGLRGIVAVYDALTKEAIKVLGDDSKAFSEIQGNMQCVTSDGKYLFFLNSGVIEIWDVENEKKIQRLVGGYADELPIRYLGLQLSPNGKYLLATKNVYGNYHPEETAVWSLSSIIPSY